MPKKLHQPPPAGITCPKCGGNRLKVTNCRPHVGRFVRIRRCLGCGHILRTAEKVEATAHGRGTP